MMSLNINANEDIEIRLLKLTDLELWKSIRLEALEVMPEVFGGSYEEEKHKTKVEWESSLTESDVFGAFMGHELVAVAGFSINKLEKKNHRGLLFSVYAKPECRGNNIGSDIIEAVVSHAKNKVVQLHCKVITNNKAAIELYKKHGFEIYGTEPRSLKVNNEYYDQHLMVMRIDT